MLDSIYDALQTEGQGFDSPQPHQDTILRYPKQAGKLKKIRVTVLFFARSKSKLNTAKPGPRYIND